MQVTLQDENFKQWVNQLVREIDKVVTDPELRAWVRETYLTDVVSSWGVYYQSETSPIDALMAEMSTWVQGVDN